MRIQTPINRPRAIESPLTLHLRSHNARLQRLCDRNSAETKQFELRLREGDHRIKNSLQVVASGLRLQARRTEDAGARDVLLAASAQIQAVAQIHDALQLNTYLNRVDLGALVSRMCASLACLSGDASGIKISVRAMPIEAPLAIAQPLLLAANELIINAIRHAFPGGRTGAITVTLELVDQDIRLNITDDGCGLPDSYALSFGYGTRLIRAMVAKIGARLDIQSAPGASFTIVAAAPDAALDPASHTIEGAR